MFGRSISVLLVAGISLVLAVHASSQTQTTGRITGTVKDAQGAVIVGAQASVENPATGDRHSAVTDSSGTYSILQLLPATYVVNIRARGFSPAVFHDVAVGLAETSTINASLTVAQSSAEITVNDAPPPVRSDSSALASTIDSRTLESLPLPTRNFLQLLTLAPGVTAPLTNNSAIGRNSPNVSVNGARATQNGYGERQNHTLQPTALVHKA